VAWQDYILKLTGKKRSVEVKTGNTLIEQKASACSPKADKKLTALSAPEPNDRSDIGFPLLPGGIDEVLSSV
jgi:hypothetical protein